jgi:hypothetical protein
LAAAALAGRVGAGFLLAIEHLSLGWIFGFGLAFQTCIKKRGRKLFEPRVIAFTRACCCEWLIPKQVVFVDGIHLEVIGVAGLQSLKLKIPRLAQI